MFNNLKSMPLEHVAFLIAVEAHKEQKYVDKPYLYHLYTVVEILKEFDIEDNEILCAGWLHDILEDTNVSYAFLKDTFGKEIAEIVYAMTDELGRNREERKRKTLPKLDNFPKTIIVKLADWLANVRESIRTSSRHLEMYRKEYSDLRRYKAVKWKFSNGSNRSTEEAIILKQALDALWSELDVHLKEEKKDR